ncbi:Inositol-1-phosphate synthase (EC [Olavius sp. associated proteobacterium Delta 1]|nr:Inositol-1-phosphate synthase (EC [Olavius sp. associated proteobacterium Delta 1]
MLHSDQTNADSLLLLVAGAKGAVASTLAVALAAMRRDPASVLPSLTTGHMFADSGLLQVTWLAGWDTSAERYTAAIKRHGVLPDAIWQPHAEELDQTPVINAPDSATDFKEQVDQLSRDINEFKSRHQGARAVFIDLLPAASHQDLNACQDLSQLFAEADVSNLPDLAYTLAAIKSGVPVVNFTPNPVEIPAVLDEAVKIGLPIVGRDGKTGQTYLKVVLASALKARNLLVDGWYSLNILGNADGANLMDPDRAAEKLRNKTSLLDDILEYEVGRQYGAPTHKVHIDYYPPRGDAKEAWDAIDFTGLFGLPMSIRLNLLGRDSILAAPLVLDLARWAVALQMAGRSGPIPELSFYFKKPVGDSPPLTFQDQVTSLAKLERECQELIKLNFSKLNL